MSRNWVFVFPLALLIGGGYWVGTETDRAKRQISAEADRVKRQIREEAAKEAERKRPILDAQQREIDATFKEMQELIKTNPAKAQEIFDRVDAKSRQIEAERGAPKRTVQTAAEKETERLKIAELKAGFGKMQQQIDDRIKAYEQYVEALDNEAKRAKKEAEDTAKESQQRITDLMRRASENRIKRDRVYENSINSSRAKGELIDNQFYRRGE